MPETEMPLPRHRNGSFVRDMQYVANRSTGGQPAVGDMGSEERYLAFAADASKFVLDKLAELNPDANPQDLRAKIEVVQWEQMGVEVRSLRDEKVAAAKAKREAERAAAEKAAAEKAAAEKAAAEKAAPKTAYIIGIEHYKTSERQFVGWSWSYDTALIKHESARRTYHKTHVIVWVEAELPGDTNLDVHFAEVNKGMNLPGSLGPLIDAVDALLDTLNPIT